jgi:triosephosphate isomerase (TIM)
VSRVLVAGNWKMNTTVQEGVHLAEEVRDAVAGVPDVDVAVLPPFIHLWPVREVLRGSRVLLGAQDTFWERAGAYTGEISPLMFAGWCDLVLVGHSERRHILGETDDEVGRKFACAVEVGVRVMLAVGETEAQRDAGQTSAVLQRQLDAALVPGHPTPGRDAFLIAYEPVWAIGTGRTATPEQADQACHDIKEHLSRSAGIEGVQVLYGGSVTASNAAALFAEPHVDGALVGGASLRSQEFAAIVTAASRAAVPG